MALATVTIQGAFTLPDASTARGGRVRVTLAQAGSTADDGGTDVAVGGTVEFLIASDGTLQDAEGVAAALVPNDIISPAGTFYIAEFRVTSPSYHTEKRRWQLDSSPDPVDIGAIPDPTESLAVALPRVSSVTALPTPSAAYENRIVVLKVTGQPSQACICLSDGGSPATYTWETFAWATGGI